MESTSSVFSPLHGGLVFVERAAEVPAAPTTATTQPTEPKTEKKSSKSAEEPAPAAADALSVIARPPSSLSLDERVQLCMSIGEETITADDLRKLLDRKPNPIAYDGFEPSGRMHIAQGILKSINVNKLTNAGCTFIFWVADWFAMLNNKMDGDLRKIKKVGEYMVEVWKAAGMNLEHVKFLWSSEEINRNPNEYWMRVMDIARKNNLTRIKRCAQIMGRSESDEQPAAQIFYPCMQCADIFFLKADICQLGMDQRKVNVLAREYCDDIKMKNKPVIISHPMLPGLKEGQEKMSKSDPASAIFMEDSETEVNAKIKGAYCPPAVVEGNPCLQYVKHLVFGKFGKFEVSRTEANGGNKVFNSFEEVAVDYASGALHPGDVKSSLAKAVNAMIEPVRQHFKNDARARELLTTIKAYKVTK
eukprot:GILK01000881.1.p1 GENE.GILK01000881.1~~GILK01000881.1.p1  ORF type:complete len:428 (-),score=73.23 GILK01000881.1:226-1479(-)